MVFSNNLLVGRVDVQQRVSDVDARVVVGQLDEVSRVPAPNPALALAPLAPLALRRAARPLRLRALRDRSFETLFFTVIGA